MLSNFVNIIPAEETFFVAVEKPSNVSFSKDIVKLNYGSLSPFKDGDLVFTQTKDMLYIWFTKTSLPESKINIPEGYIVYELVRKDKDAVALLEKGNITVAVILKNGNLKSQTFFPSEKKREKLFFLIKEHFSEKPNVLELTLKDLKVPFNVLLKFTSLSLFNKREEFLNRCLNFAAYTLASVFIGVSVVSVGFKFYLKKIEEKKQRELIAAKEKNRDIKSLINSLEAESKFWSGFINRELSFPNFYKVLNSLMVSLQNADGYVKSLDYRENRITGWVSVNSTKESNFIKLLQKEAVFSKVKVLSSVKDRDKPNNVVLSVDLQISQEGKNR